MDPQIKLSRHVRLPKNIYELLLLLRRVLFLGLFLSEYFPTRKRPLITTLINSPPPPQAGKLDERKRLRMCGWVVGNQSSNLEKDMATDVTTNICPTFEILPLTFIIMVDMLCLRTTGRDRLTKEKQRIPYPPISLLSLSICPPSVIL